MQSYKCTFIYQVNIYSYSVYTCPLANFRIACLLCLHFRTLHAYIYSPLCCDRVFSLSSVQIDKVNAFYNYSKRASAGWVCSRSVLMDFVPFSHTDTHIEPNRQLHIHTHNLIHIHCHKNITLYIFILWVWMTVCVVMSSMYVCVCIPMSYVNRCKCVWALIMWLAILNTYKQTCYMNVMHKFKLLVSNLFYTLIKLNWNELNRSNCYYDIYHLIA